MMGKSPLITLNNGVPMPALGRGVFQSTPEQTAGAVDAAIANGYHPATPSGVKNPLEHPVIVDLAATYGKTPAQVVLRWHLQEE